MRVWTRLAKFAVYIAMWYVTSCALYTDLQHQFDHLGSRQGQAGAIDFKCGEHRRDDLGFAVGFAALPPVWVVAPFITGFYYHGFNWTFAERPECAALITTKESEPKVQ
jgi:hypothetical protein